MIREHPELFALQDGIYQVGETAVGLYEIHRTITKDLSEKADESSAGKKSRTTVLRAG